MDLNDKIVIYRTADGQTTVDVRMDGDTVWLSQAQMAELFQKDRTVIGRHINNIYKEHELERETTCANFAHVGKDADQTYQTALYNLDVIISVGYRVKSQRGTQFRIWANKVLKDYLVKGYAVNKVLTEQRYTELKQLVAVLGRTVKAQETLTSDDALNLVEVVSDYAYALDTLDKYDYQQLTVDQTTNEAKFHATYEGAMQAIEELKAKFGGSQWFAHEKDDSFKSSIGQIYQTFGGQDLYPSVEEKAAMLLYLVTKNHSFSDGNKRIAATLFLWFMAGNGILYNPDGTKRIADNTLVALTLMIAESRTEEKDVMVKVVVNLINKNNYE
ncbi:virulence protein RhuM/Fic/DOC family protein [Bacteroides caecicola]|uniref:Virulence protein RhuM/Fic/DOC family protein n=1 Tax=Bacteroides caecicola TaxID=1462569 RepID=A0ABS2F7W4_9BACE|nr:virulence protein RhuM/Fic/DOC family protein [Bacteroides caecicola]MBM6806169.1 virulence protein RhuM/Fic/DOC family protein [Bacteroides caecicola]